MIGKERTTKNAFTEAERHQRFLDAAQDVEASDDPEAFDPAFGAVLTPPQPKD